MDGNAGMFCIPQEYIQINPSRLNPGRRSSQPHMSLYPICHDGGCFALYNMLCGALLLYDTLYKLCKWCTQSVCDWINLYAKWIFLLWWRVLLYPNVWVRRSGVYFKFYLRYSSGLLVRNCVKYKKRCVYAHKMVSFITHRLCVPQEFECYVS